MKTLLPEGLLQTLQALDADQPAAVLIRHAERAPRPRNSRAIAAWAAARSNSASDTWPWATRHIA